MSCSYSPYKYKYCAAKALFKGIRDDTASDTPKRQATYIMPYISQRFINSTCLETVSVRGVVDDGHLGQVSSQHVQVLQVVALQRHARISVQAIPAHRGEGGSKSTNNVKQASNRSTRPGHIMFRVCTSWEKV